MATGYTAIIAEGDREVSFKEFALGCARAFGALISMRDDPSDTPIPEKFEVDDYHLNELAKAKEALDKARAMTDDEAQALALAAYNDSKTSAIARMAKCMTLKAKYEDMLEKASNYVPPSEDHQEFKNFMIQQLTDSIKWDCDLKYYEKNLKEIKPMSGLEWRALEIKDAKYNVEYHTKKYAEDVDRVNSRNIWVSRLKQSLV